MTPNTDTPRPTRTIGAAVAALVGGLLAGELIYHLWQHDVLAAFARAAGIVLCVYLLWPVLPTRWRDMLTGANLPIGQRRFRVAAGFIIGLILLLLLSRSVRTDVGGTLIIVLMCAAIAAVRDLGGPEADER